MNNEMMHIEEENVRNGEMMYFEEEELCPVSTIQR